MKLNLKQKTLADLQPGERFSLTDTVGEAPTHMKLKTWEPQPDPFSRSQDRNMVSLITGEPVRAELTTKVYQPKRASPFGQLSEGAPFEFCGGQYLKIKEVAGYNAINLSTGTLIQIGSAFQVLELEHEGEWGYEA